MSAEIILQALVVAGVTALATGFVNSRIMDAKLADMERRLERIESYLNGLLKEHKGNDRHERS